MELTIEQTLQEAIAAHKEGKLQEAERLYRSILQSQPLHPDANHNLGVIAVSVNKADAALPLFKVALEANPKIEQFWLSYIGALIKEQQFDNAKLVIEQAKKQGVDEEKLNVLEAQLVAIPQTENTNSASPSQQQLKNLLEDYENGRYEDAEKSAHSLALQYPSDNFSWKVLSAVLKKTGRTSEAVFSGKKTVELNPDDADAHNNLGNTFQDLGRFKEAEASYARAIALNPDYAEAHSNLGNTLQELGRSDEAEASLRLAIALKPDYAEAHSNLGNTLQELGRLDEAEASYNQAIALKPDYSAAHNNKGITLKDLGRLDEAVASLTQAIALDPDDAEAHSNLGIILNGLGRRESALKHFQINLDLRRGCKLKYPKHKSFVSISKAKIDHDIEQFEYLANSGYDDTDFNELAAVYRIVASEIDCALDTEIVPLSDKHRGLLGDTYNRPFHILEAPLLDESTMGKNLNVDKITNDYFSHEFGLTYIDEFLSPKALASLRDFLLGSTIWFDFFHSGGYIGSYLKDGLASPLILQIAEDLRLKLPKIFKHHKLMQLWAYKYDSRARDKAAFDGISAHADFAAVNVNFWITPNSANLNKLSGGLVVYNSEAPHEWDFKTYNSDEKRIREEIAKDVENKNVIPYNENRMVLFNSNLFHETDNIDFKDGYENRRINVTMLFGKREH